MSENHVALFLYFSEAGSKDSLEDLAKKIAKDPEIFKALQQPTKSYIRVNSTERISVYWPVAHKHVSRNFFADVINSASRAHMKSSCPPVEEIICNNGEKAIFEAQEVILDS